MIVMVLKYIEWFQLIIKTKDKIVRMNMKKNCRFFNKQMNFPKDFEKKFFLFLEQIF